MCTSERCLCKGVYCIPERTDWDGCEITGVLRLSMRSNTSVTFQFWFEEGGPVLAFD